MNPQNPQNLLLKVLKVQLRENCQTILMLLRMTRQNGENQSAECQEERSLVRWADRARISPEHAIQNGEAGSTQTFLSTVAAGTS